MTIKNNLFILMLLLCFTSMATSAKDVSVITISTADKNSFTVQLTNATQAQVQVTLNDEKGVTLLNETLLQSSLKNRKYNLQDLPLGNYILMVTYDNLIKVQPIKKENETLEIEAEELQTIFQPTFKSHSEYLDLNMLCLSDAKILLEIIDEAGHVIYSETTQPKGALQRRFNLSQLEEGDYTFSVEVVDTLINKEFSELIKWSPSANILTAL